MTPKKEAFVSIDIETDGPAPGLNSMLALGAALFTEEFQDAPLSTWYATLHPLPGATQNQGTMDWWATQQAAWAEVNSNRQQPQHALCNFAEWVKSVSTDRLLRPVAVAWPAAFDFAFVNYYCHRFAGGNPLGFSCLDIRSFANGLARYPGYHGPAQESPGALNHVAVDDAVAQGLWFMTLRKRCAVTEVTHGGRQ